MSHRLTFYFFPSPYGLDWSSPRALTLTTLRNQLDLSKKPRHPIGHVNIEVRRDGDEKPLALTGMVAKDPSIQRRQVLLEHYGLGVLFASVPGRLETAEEVLAQLPHRYRNGRLSVLSLRVSASMAERVCDYVQEFRARGYDHSYGLPNRPLFGEGSGCSAFAGSFLEVTGLAHAELEVGWTRRLLVPSELIGGPSTGRRVPLPRVLAANAWAASSAPHQPLYFWDPDRMHVWLTRTFEDLRGGAPFGLAAPVERAMRKRARELIVDLRDAKVPSASFWPQATPAITAR